MTIISYYISRHVLVKLVVKTEIEVSEAISGNMFLSLFLSTAFIIASVGAETRSIHERLTPMVNAVRSFITGPVRKILALSNPTENFP